METTMVNGVLQLRFDIYQAVALGAIMYYVGLFIRSKLPILVKLSIPAPVIGGLIIAIISLILQSNKIATFSFDSTLQTVLMTCFFCTVGMNASYRLVIRGGLMIAAFWAVSGFVAVIQNVVNIPVANAFHLNPLMAIMGGSVPMIGGLGTSAAFGGLFQNEWGVEGALAAAIACATFGMIAGSLVGGPLGEWLIKTHKLKTPNQLKKESHYANAALEEAGAMENKLLAQKDEDEEEEHKVTGPHLMKNLAFVLAATGVGSAVSFYLREAGITLPGYLGAMVTAIAIRNIGDVSGKYHIDSKSVGMIGDISLALFITMAINALNLYQLINLALPLMIMMILQVSLILLIAYFLVFRLFGKSYDSAVMASGLCGFGLGATPNALVCMQAITMKHGPSEKAFFVVPIVGAFLSDITNAAAITFIGGFLR